MHTPRTEAAEGRDRHAPAERDGWQTVGAVEHYACGLAGLLATGVVAVLFYPALVSATRPLHLLSSVAIVFVILTAWVLVWLSLEFGWEWRAGRLGSGDRTSE